MRKFGKDNNDDNSSVQGVLFTFNNMRSYYEELSRILSVNGNNTVFTLPVSQIESHSSDPEYPNQTNETLDSLYLASPILSYLF